MEGRLGIFEFGDLDILLSDVYYVNEDKTRSRISQSACDQLMRYGV